MEKVILHSRPYAILSTTSLCVMNAANISTTCAQGIINNNLQLGLIVVLAQLNHICMSFVQSVKSPFKKARDLVLWVWSTHNKVNERLMKEEASLDTGDPKFLKIIWPPKELCPLCYLSSNQKNIEWDNDHVFKFLKNYYGAKLVSLYKEKRVAGIKEESISATEDLTVATNTLVVPIGAALAIAIASCAFGALSCYWRTQQKNRKPRRSWN